MNPMNKERETELLETISRLTRENGELKEAIRENLKRNIVTIKDSSNRELEGWIAIPWEAFDALRASLQNKGVEG
jgi:hypothetical protein